MIVNLHSRSPKPDAMTLTASPLTVWLSRLVELVIEPNDRLFDVMQEVQKHWPHLSDPEAAQLIACWFAIGERRGGVRPTNQPWTDEERDVSPTRRYFKSSNRATTPSGSTGRSR